jgi:hypothetical protein
MGTRAVDTFCFHCLGGVRRVVSLYYLLDGVSVYAPQGWQLCVGACAYTQAPPLWTDQSHNSLDHGPASGVSMPQ